MANSSSPFGDALQSGDLVQIATFAKADRHCHSALSASLQSIEVWAGVFIRKAPIRMRSFDEMRHYMHEVLDPHTNSRAGFEFTAEQALREAIQDGVKVLEMSLDVRFIRFYVSDKTVFFDLVGALRAKYASVIDFRPEIGISKNRSPSEEIPLGMECVETGLFKSIDLYGNEDAQAPESYQGLYRRAKRQGLKLKAHSGEFGDAALVERTIRDAEPAGSATWGSLSNLGAPYDATAQGRHPTERMPQQQCGPFCDGQSRQAPHSYSCSQRRSGERQLG